MPPVPRQCTCLWGHDPANVDHYGRCTHCGGVAPWPEVEHDLDTHTGSADEEPTRYRDHRWDVSEPLETEAGWTYTVRGRDQVEELGPFVDRDAALGHQHTWFATWRERAEALGGWAWRRTAREWVLTLPEDVHGGGLPLHPSPTVT